MAGTMGAVSISKGAAGSSAVRAGVARRCGLSFMLLVCSCALAWGQSPAPADGVADRGGAASWIARMQRASESSIYTGIYVVSSGSGFLSSARIWHLWDGGQELERVDALSGPERRAYRQGDEVTVVLPGTHVALSERRGALRRFPGGIGAMDLKAVERHYSAERLPQDRVAGFAADVVRLRPHDARRFGYQIWSERNAGLPLRIQVLDGGNRILEQAFFSELRLNLSADQVAPELQLPSTAGYRIRRVTRDRIEAADRSWSLGDDAAGFELRDCWHRVGDGIEHAIVDQCVLSDGLASVSLFFEPYQPRRHAGAKSMHAGALHAISRKWPDESGAWWITLIGEVPESTLNLLAHSLRRGQ